MLELATWERNMPMREIETEHTRSLGFQGYRRGSDTKEFRVYQVLST
jgi:hypothetical protein